MKLDSLYKFLRAYFNYPAKGNKWYALMINDTMKVIRESFEEKNAVPIIKYMNSARANPLTKKMLEKLAVMSGTGYRNPFREIKYFKTYVKIDRSLINSKHRGIEVPVECGIDARRKKVIIFVFSSRNNMEEEIKVLKGLLNEFPVENELSVEISKIAYWNLSKGEETVVDYRKLQGTEKEKLIEAANKL